ncbi:MAG: DUF5060 domain-containing protein [Planctomycetales bacterium]|nr:DUF5060 domain-containing protein [Planctomycetales bacterium]
MRRFAFVVVLGLLIQCCQWLPAVERWGRYEISLYGPVDGNPYLDVTLSAEFTCGDETVHCPGFYDGNGTYRIRFSPPSVGQWNYATTSNVPGLNGKSGQFTADRPSGQNHGPVQVSQVFHFAYADGTPYRPIGTTCYAWTHQAEDLEEQTLDSLKHSPFNKLRMCVFPKNYAYNATEPPRFPFEGTPPNKWEYERFNPDFFRHLENRIEQLEELGIEADLILFHPYDEGRWGFDRMDEKSDDRYLRYMLARFSWYRNVWWSLANEFDFMDQKQAADWDRYLEIIAAEDPHQRLRSVHNGRQIYNHNRPEITHASIQNGSAVSDFGRAILYRDVYRKPVVFDEVKYEGNITQRWGNLSAQEMVHRFWQGTIAGTYVGHGETYQHPENIIWWAKGGQLHGQSPDRIAFLRSIVEDAPHGIEPIDKWQNERTAGRKGELYLVYLGKQISDHWNFELPRERLEEPLKLKGELIDTWNMTVHPIEGEFDAVPFGQYVYYCPERPTIKIPEIPYLLLRFTVIH